MFKKVKRSYKVFKRLLENARSELGEKTAYVNKYDPSLIFPIDRKNSRDLIGDFDFSFKGLDIWNAYEFSGLNEEGRPFCNILKIGYDSGSKSIVESKSLKLYLNSFNQTNLNMKEAFEKISHDLKTKLNANIVMLALDQSPVKANFKEFKCIDKVKVTEPFVYKLDPNILKFERTKDNKEINLMTNLLKSNCRHSGLPDFGTLFITYKPNLHSPYKVTEESLLRFIVSLREYKEFHEECVERIMYNLVTKLQPQYLRIEAKYSRRGGIDISPIRVYDPNNYLDYSFEKEYNELKRNIK